MLASFSCHVSVILVSFECHLSIILASFPKQRLRVGVLTDFPLLPVPLPQHQRPQSHQLCRRAAGAGVPASRAAGCCCWLLLLAAAAGCCCWLLLLAAAAGCCCWLLLLAAPAGCSCWLLLLAATAGCCCWLLLLAAAAGCCCWLLLLAAAGSYADTCTWTPNSVLSNIISNLMVLGLVASEAPAG